MASKELKVVRLLKALDNKELERLELFLDAEFFVTDKSYLNYFRTLREHFEDGEMKASSEVLFNLVYPGDNFSYNKFARLNSQLLQLVYRFMSVEYLDRDPLQHWGMVIEVLEERLELELLDLTLPSLERALDRAPDSLEKLRQKLHLREVLFATGDGAWREAREVSPAWVIEALDEYYEMAMFRLECAILNHELAVGKAFDNPSNFTNPESKTKNGLVYLYELAKANLEQPDSEKIWLKLKDGLASQISEMEVDKFSPEFREVCTYTLNGCIRLNNRQRGRSIGRQHLYEIYKLLLDHRILLKNDLLSPWHFKNIIKNLVITERYQEASERIDEFGDNLSDDYQRNAVVYSEAFLNFNQGNLQGALKATNLLLQDYKDVFYGLDGRTLLLRCYFELADTTQLDMQGEAFRQFLRRLSDRKTLPKAYIKVYSEFLKNLIGLGKIVFGPPDKLKGKISRFQEKLEENALHRDWLLEKIGVK